MASIYLRVSNPRNISIIIAAALAMALAVAQDLIRYHFYDQNAFYLSESLLFESFWILFAPFSGSIYYSLKQFRAKIPSLTLPVMLPVTLVISGLHFLTFSLVVFAISSISGSHVFQFSDVLRHSLAEHLYICLSVYSAICILFRWYENPAVSRRVTPPDDKARLSRINITNGTNNILIEVDEIIFITASSPYSCIHTARGKFLYAETLRSLEEKLDPDCFLRVHKSSIINLKRVVSYKSRLNGDYDLALENGYIVRLSRNYKMKFRSLFA